MAVLGIHCCTASSLVVANGGCSLAAVCRLLIAVASLVAEHRLQGMQASVVAACGLSGWALKHSLSSCGQ